MHGYFRTIDKLHYASPFVIIIIVPYVTLNLKPQQPMPASKQTNEAPAPSIEELIQRLEEITRRIENPDTGLENSISLYEEGISVAEQCRNRLQETRKKLETINPELSKSKTDNSRPKDLFGMDS
jgi:exodeoxyribonuclease VII small subunit